MRWINNQVRFGVAAVVVCAGAAYGAHLYRDQPETDRSKAQQIRQLAERIQTQTPSAMSSLTPAAVPAVRPVVVTEALPKVRVQAAEPVREAAPKPSTAAPAPPPAPAAPVDPIKNIALMGVTHQGETGQAWLVDLESHAREVVGEGQEAFGFTIKEIDDESVLLARGAETYNLRLGEKEIPTTAVAVAQSTETAGAGGNGGGFGGGDNRDDRRARFAAMMSQMANGGGRGSWGGRSWSGGSGGNWGNSGGNWGNNGGSRWASNQGGRSFGGFSGGFGGGFSGGSGNFGSRNNQNASLNRPTSNPQEARRRKSRLVGGGDAIAEPAAFNNPQTMRRLGSASGQAFGTGNNNQNQNRR